jgi:hypothetical protein
MTKRGIPRSISIFIDIESSTTPRRFATEDDVFVKKVIDFLLTMNSKLVIHLNMGSFGRNGFFIKIRFISEPHYMFLLIPECSW